MVGGRIAWDPWVAVLGIAGTRAPGTVADRFGQMCRISTRATHRGGGVHRIVRTGAAVAALTLAISAWDMSAPGEPRSRC